jgi:hypothetical protein
MWFVQTITVKVVLYGMSRAIGLPDIIFQILDGYNYCVSYCRRAHIFEE